MDQELDIGKEFDTKIKIPKDVKNRIYTRLFKEFCIAILTVIYFIFVNFGYSKLSQMVFTNVLYCFSGALIASTVVLFEVSYRKVNEAIGLHGVEMLILSVISLFMPYVYFHRGKTVMMLYSLMGLYIGIYYAVKALVVYVKEIRKYKNSLSDVKEIVVEENESYLDEVSERKFENIDESFDRSSASVLRKRDRIRITLERLTHSRKKAEKEEDEIVDDAMDNKIEDMVEDEIKVEEVKPKRRRGRPRKKPVPSLATAGRKKKKDGENND